MTMGMVEVAFLAAIVAGVPLVTRMSTLRPISSPASFGNVRYDLRRNDTQSPHSDHPRIRAVTAHREKASMLTALSFAGVVSSFPTRQSFTCRLRTRG